MSIFSVTNDGAEVSLCPDSTSALKLRSNSFVLLCLLQRYYGKSLPFGKDSFNIPQVGLLTVEQALADYSILITELRQQLSASRCPVIVFGGR